VPNPYGQFVPDPLSPSGFRWQRHGEHPPTQMLPAIPPAPELGENDDLVRRTFNGLRADDLALEQPPQSPAWTP
jgi:hypothetical protein